ncbi:MAG: S1/P1 nuclease, partial [Bradyrhizobium sp.]|nr:S1/P1 nuclease [Bradyrhizobium sp.]
MRLSRSFVLSVTAATLTLIALLGADIRPAAAWWAPGHAVIAMMAYRQMKPATRAAVDANLKQHPDYKNWMAELPAGVTDAQRGEYVFAIAATWPDRIKDAKDDTVSIKFFNPADKRNPVPNPFPAAPAFYPDLQTHETWHYLDIPINMDGKNRTVPAEESILNALPLCEGNVAATYLPPGYRAYYLAWLAHLVGDIHQPLHATGRFSAAQTRGDAGGNGVHFQSDGSAAQPRNLHAYW